MDSDHWRHTLHIFVDENAQIYTVTNVPPIINISTSSEPGTLISSSLGNLLRPHISGSKYPELPFLLRKLPVTDPLLSRLCANPASLSPTPFEGGWALPDDIRNAWIRLEKGLLHVSELLLTSTDQSPFGTSARYAIRDQEHWPLPEDFGYHKLHASAHAAMISIRRAHTAFQLLAARCSLAVALWLFPGPGSKARPQMPATQSDSSTQTAVPEWVAFLRRARVPSSWIDAIGDSLITDFGPNLRVGAVFDPSPSAKWPPILPLLRAANVPVFVRWHNPTQMVACAERWPFMKTFAPRSPAEVALALQHPPAGKPRAVTLCIDTKTRLLPDYSAIDGSAPPFGPYQLPGESRLEFFTRREHHRPDQERQETQLGLKWRLERLAHAQTGLPLHRRSRVYLWVSPELVYPDLAPRWHGGEYRHAIPPAAYRSIWMVHPPSCRQYNSFYNEWDLWFPLSWGTADDNTPEDRAIDESDTNVALGTSVLADPHPTPTSLTASVGEQHSASENPLETILDDDDDNLLNPTPEDRNIQEVEMQHNFHLRSWFGIAIADTRTFPGIDYEKWTNRLPSILGDMDGDWLNDPPVRKCIAGWAAAMDAHDWRSRALANTWDLDARNPSYLLRSDHDDNDDDDPRHTMSLEHRRASARHSEADPDNVFRWVLVRFHRDPDAPTSGQDWSLFTSPMGVLLLARRRSEADTSRAALSTLVAVGVPVRTGVLRPIGPQPPSAPDSDSASASESLPTAQATGLRRRLPKVWREKGDRPTVKDYDAYCQRVLELSNAPHARAAWLKGGIVWRIMLEVTGRGASLSSQLPLEEVLAAGPSCHHEGYQQVTQETEGAAYFDDALSNDEMDIISGVVKVYTGRGSQTEDVSWWPKHSAWVRGGSYSGIWTPLHEQWFQRRLKNIYEGNALPRNAGEWKLKLWMHKRAGVMADIVDQASWEFTYRNFIQRPEPDLV